MKNQAEIYSDVIMLCRNYSDVTEAFETHKVAALLTIEDGSALTGDIDNLKLLHELGVRSICLTWNYQ